jgi:hypothetical protein
MKTLSLLVCLSGLAGFLSAQNNNPSHPGRLLQVDDFSRFEMSPTPSFRRMVNGFSTRLPLWMSPAKSVKATSGR